jgi:hypothetical protein
MNASLYPPFVNGVEPLFVNGVEPPFVNGVEPPFVNRVLFVVIHEQFKSFCL